MFYVTVISRVMENNILDGFMLAIFDDNKNRFEITYCPVQALNNVLAVPDAQFTNCVYSEQYKTLTGTEVSLTKYPEINKNYAVTKNKCLVLLAELLDIDTNQYIGVLCTDGTGKQYQLSYAKAQELAKLFKPVNFDITSSGVVTKMPVPNMKVRAPKRQNLTYSSAKGESKPLATVNKAVLSNEQNSIGVIDLDAVKASEFAQPAQQKLFLAIQNMQKVSPYYYCVLEAIPKRQVQDGVRTMGVSENELFYNIQFVAEMTVEEITFVLIHEIRHLMDRHAIRGRGKERRLFNIAADIYINATICRDFGCQYEGPAVTINNGKIKTPTCGCFPESVGIALDFSKDTPETIYLELLKENKNKNRQKGNQGKNQGQQGNQGQQSGQSGQSNSDNQSGQQGQGQSQGQQGQSQSGQGQSSASSINNAVRQLIQDAQDAHNQNKTKESKQACKDINSGLQDLKDALSQGAPTQQAEQRIEQGVSDLANAVPDASNQLQQDLNNLQQALQSRAQNKQLQDITDNNNVEGDLANQTSEEETTVIFRGKKFKVENADDIYTGDKSANAEEADAKSKELLARIKTKLDLEEQKNGALAVNAGDKAGNVARGEIEFGLQRELNWRILLKNALQKDPKKLFTLATPNRKMMANGYYMPGSIPAGKPTKASGVQIAIDTSGSIDNTQLSLILSEIAGMYKHFKLEGQLIYWDTEVANAGEIQELKDLLAVKPKGGGGTDVNCVFEYLMQQNKSKLKSPIRPKDITRVFIVTDGYFSEDYSEWGKYFAQKTVWLIYGDDNFKNFKPKFGTKVQLKGDY